MNTVDVQNETKYKMGQLLPDTRQYILHVTYQLLTTMMWNKVTSDMKKSLKFIK